MLSRRIGIYALFSKHSSADSLSALRLLTTLGDESPRPPDLRTPGKNPAGALGDQLIMFQRQ